jgi:anti-sigma B factor antagonist
MPPSSPQHIRHRRLGDVTIVGFETPYLQSDEEIAKASAELSRLVEEEDREKVILSFSGVRFMSSSMLAEVVKLHRKLAKAKGRLRVCGLSPEVRQVVRASQLDKLLEVFDDEKSALEKF